MTRICQHVLAGICPRCESPFVVRPFLCGAGASGHRSGGLADSVTGVEVAAEVIADRMIERTFVDTLALAGERINLRVRFHPRIPAVPRPLVQDRLTIALSRNERRWRWHSWRSQRASDARKRRVSDMDLRALRERALGHALDDAMLPANDTTPKGDIQTLIRVAMHRRVA